MRDGVIIGVDAGTSVIKSVAFSPEGEQLADLVAGQLPPGDDPAREEDGIDRVGGHG